MDEKYLENVRLLLVDDNVFIRSLVRRVLAVLGATQIGEANDGTEALQVMRSFRPDVVILDWEMQPMNGLDLAKAIRTGDMSPAPYVPIIMLSGYSEVERVVTARDAGINEFVVKPFTAVRLFGSIHSVIERPRPFIKMDSYFGPCRRRRNVGAPRGKDRRRSEAPPTVENAADPGET